MEITDKDISLFAKLSHVVLDYDLIKNENVLIEFTNFLIAITEQETSVSAKGLQSAYACLLAISDLIDGDYPDIKLKFTDKRKLMPLKKDISELATRMNNYYHFDM